MTDYFRPLRKKRKSDSEPKKFCVSPLVNPMLNHPNGAYGGHFKYDPAICEKVPELYAGGKSDAYVAIQIGVSKNTLYRWCKDYPEFAHAVELGRTLSETHWQEISETGVTCETEIQPTIWAIQMRNRYGYDKKEGDATPEATDADKEANILKATNDKLTGKLSDY